METSLMIIETQQSGEGVKTGSPEHPQMEQNCGNVPAVAFQPLWNVVGIHSIQGAFPLNNSSLSGLLVNPQSFPIVIPL